MRLPIISIPDTKCLQAVLLSQDTFPALKKNPSREFVRIVQLLPTRVLGQLPLGIIPHRIKLKPNYCPPGPQSLGQLPTRTTPQQDHYKPIKPLMRSNNYTVGNCPGGIYTQI